LGAFGADGAVAEGCALGGAGYDADVLGHGVILAAGLTSVSD
jgi:hypothetical protein